MKEEINSKDYAKYRAIYEKNFQERHVNKNLDHPSPRFFIHESKD